MPPASKATGQAPPLRGQKRKAESESEVTAKPHYTLNGKKILMGGEAVMFTISSNEKRSEKRTLLKELVIANSPVLAALIHKTKYQLRVQDLVVFDYFVQWMYNPEGNFEYDARKHGIKPGSWNYPYTPLVELYLLAKELKIPNLANAVINKIRYVFSETEALLNKVVDRATIALVYTKTPKTSPLRCLFVDQVAWHATVDLLKQHNNAEFIHSVAQRAIMRYDSPKKGEPPCETYYIDTFEQDLVGGTNPETAIPVDDDDNAPIGNGRRA